MHRNNPVKAHFAPSSRQIGWPLAGRATPSWRRSGVFLASLGWTIAAMASADVPEIGSATNLRAIHAALGDKLTHNEFKLPLYLDSHQSSGSLRGDIHAVVDYPFATVKAALVEASHWSDILPLHLNVKYCRASEDSSGQRLILYLGRKFDQNLDAGHRLELSFKVTAQTSDYFQVAMTADKGPVGTRDYRIMLEATPLEGGKTFLHYSYAYAFGLAAKLETEAYFKTLGSAKVGFTVVGTQPDGQPTYVDDMRGALERNTMRYYLAIDAYLGALSIPPDARLEHRLRSWFESTERYPLQLHEETENEYLESKRREYLRQQVEH